MSLEGQNRHPLIKSMDEVKDILARKQTIESQTKPEATHIQEPPANKEDAVEELADEDLEEVHEES